jgi:sugar phosphate isomerase/epimerase
MKRSSTRRRFIKQSAALAAGGSLTLPSAWTAETKPAPFKISLAEWSLHRTLFGKKLEHMDFPRVAKEDYGIEAIELVNQFFKDKARNQSYLGEFRRRADDLGVRILLIMCDDEGALGDPFEGNRTKAAENHYKWVEAAKTFGCHSIRVNAETKGVGNYGEQQDHVADGLRHLCAFAKGYGLNVIVENHGGLSSNGAWLAGVMKRVKMPNCGTLPDFGNFNLGDGKMYDRYKGVAEMMPLAKGVSAKSMDFDEQGNCIETDYRRMLKIVLGAGYHGHLGIEYSGSKLSEPEGIRATKKLLEKIREESA